MYIMVRFFSLLFCLFLLKRGAKRENERETTNRYALLLLSLLLLLLLLLFKLLHVER
jgi:hypothetical protein